MELPLYSTPYSVYVRSIANAASPGMERQMTAQEIAERNNISVEQVLALAAQTPMMIQRIRTSRAAFDALFDTPAASDEDEALMVVAGDLARIRDLRAMGHEGPFVVNLRYDGKYEIVAQDTSRSA
jgi:hypothetical protein